MTAPATTKKTSTPAKDVEVKSEERIPEGLLANSILADFCRQYLSVVDLVTNYNDQVLAAKSSDWNATKVLEKAREFANPSDKNVPPNELIKEALKTWSDTVDMMNRARRAVLDVTAKELGITLSATAERNSETEAPLKEKRKIANEIGNQLTTIAKMTSDASASSLVTAFLNANPLPVVGRDQARTFGESEKTTPKYRVNVQVIDQDGNVRVNEAGFTKAALALTKLYERGTSPKSEVLRKAWETAGNTPETTVVDPVEFDDNNLHFVISKK